jgi:riboflavin kinase/FMN adenylyltransferase
MTVFQGDPHEWSFNAASSAVAIGVFDGVHKGHQTVLRKLVGTGLPSVAVTFDPHPLALAAPERAPQLIGSVAQRIEWLRAEGVHAVGVLPFAQIRDWTPEAFVEVVLVHALHADIVAVGEDFRFGRGRSGDVHVLRALGKEAGFRVVALELLREDAAAPVSSTSIRNHIVNGEMAQAQALLGRPFTIRGPVVSGDGRGRTIGIPTANILVSSAAILPGSGVYAALVDGRHKAVVNVGNRPTFGGGDMTVEAHILDFDADIYGQTIDIALDQRIRAEKKFDGPEQLVAQIHHDIGVARQILKRKR